MIKVAIVDDKASNRNILEDKLKRNNYFLLPLRLLTGKNFWRK
jgi:hypothetical protein